MPYCLYFGFEAAVPSPSSPPDPPTEGLTSLKRRVYGLEDSLAKVLRSLESNNVADEIRALTAAWQSSQSAQEMPAKHHDDAAGPDVDSGSKKSQSKASRGKLLSHLLSLDVSHPEVVLPIIARAVVGLLAKGSSPLSLLHALCSPHKSPLPRIQAKEGVYGDSRTPLGMEAKASLCFDSVVRTALPGFVKKLPAAAPGSLSEVKDQYEALRADVSTWRACDPLTSNAATIVSVVRAAMKVGRVRCRSLLREAVGAAVAPIAFGGSKNLRAELAFTDAAAPLQPTTVADAQRDHFVDAKRFQVDIACTYKVLGSPDNNCVSIENFGEYSNPCIRNMHFSNP